MTEVQNNKMSMYQETKKRKLEELQKRQEDIKLLKTDNKTAMGRLKKSSLDVREDFDVYEDIKLNLHLVHNHEIQIDKIIQLDYPAVAYQETVKTEKYCLNMNAFHRIVLAGYTASIGVFLYCGISSPHFTPMQPEVSNVENQYREKLYMPLTKSIQDEDLLQSLQIGSQTVKDEEALKNTVFIFGGKSNAYEETSHVIPDRYKCACVSNVSYTDSKWQKKKRLQYTSSNRLYFSAVRIGFVVHIIGGIDYNREPTAVSLNLCYDISSNNWSTSPPLKTSRIRFGTAYLRSTQTLFAFGGCSLDGGGTMVTNMEYTHPGDQDSTWEYLTNSEGERASLNRIDFATVCSSKYIFVIGGWSFTSTNTTYFNDIIYFDPALLKWKKLCNLPFPLAHAAVSLLGDTMYIFGGVTEYEKTLDSVIRVDVLRRTCTVLNTQMPEPLCHQQAFVSYNAVHLFYGASSPAEKPKDIRYVFSLLTHRFTKESTPSTTCGRLLAAIC